MAYGDCGFNPVQNQRPGRRRDIALRNLTQIIKQKEILLLCGYSIMLWKRLPSRVVTLIDELEAKGLIKRQRSKTDRRAYALVLTKRGQQTLVQLSKLAAEHEADLCAALTADELHTL